MTYSKIKTNEKEFSSLNYFFPARLGEGAVDAGCLIRVLHLKFSGIRHLASGI
jgi:hypothetical protein